MGRFARFSVDGSGRGSGVWDVGGVVCEGEELCEGARVIGSRSDFITACVAA